MERPNIVLMIAHDLGDHVGPYGWFAGHTPRLDQLAAEGIRARHHFVTSPGCSQSRSSLVTGRYPHSNGQFGLAHLGWDLHRDEVTLPMLLGQAGYDTALFGIWHLHAWSREAFGHVSRDHSVRDYSPDAPAAEAASRAAEWLGARPKDASPFFLHIGFWEAHRPFCGQDGDPDPRREPDTSELKIPDYLPDGEATRREYAHLRQSVQDLDLAVGRVLDALKENGQAENTWVIFTSDHGPAFPRAKGTLYDPGLQVALISRWPGRLPEGRMWDGLSSNLDILSTLAGAAGIGTSGREQGLDLLDSWTKGTPSPRQEVFAEKNYHEHYDPIRAIRTEEWKLIQNFARRPMLVMPSDVYNSTTRQAMLEDEAFWAHRPEWELYHLPTDSRECNNLACDPRHQPAFLELAKRLKSWMRETGDPLLKGPIPRPVLKASGSGSS